MASKDMYCWDSCVIIDLLQKAENLIDILYEYTDKGEKGELDIVVSAYAMVEVFKLPELGITTQEEEDAITDFFSNPYVLPRVVDSRIALKAREICRTTNIKPKDAVHVATAAMSGALAFHTTEPGLLRHNCAIMNKDGMPLRIEVPLSLLPPLPLLDYLKKQDDE